MQTFLKGYKMAQASYCQVELLVRKLIVWIFRQIATEPANGSFISVCAYVYVCMSVSTFLHVCLYVHYCSKFWGRLKMLSALLTY